MTVYVCGACNALVDVVRHVRCQRCEVLFTDTPPVPSGSNTTQAVRTPAQIHSPESPGDYTTQAPATRQRRSQGQESVSRSVTVSPVQGCPDCAAYAEHGQPCPCRWSSSDEGHGFYPVGYRLDGTPLYTFPGTGRVFRAYGPNGKVHEVDPVTGYGNGYRLYRPIDDDYPVAVGLAIRAVSP